MPERLPDDGILSSAAERTVPCPGCRKPAVYGAANRWRPFCSERCRQADLGGWASERFRLPADRSSDSDSRPDERH